MKIRAIKDNIRSMKLNVPVDGIIDIDGNGIADVSAKCGKMLIEGTSDWEEFKPSKDTSKTDKDGEQAKKASESKKIDDDEVIKGLENLSLADCIETAKQAKYPKKEWEKLTKNDKVAEKLMRNYLITKYKNSIK